MMRWELVPKQTKIESQPDSLYPSGLHQKGTSKPRLGQDKARPISRRKRSRQRDTKCTTASRNSAVELPQLQCSSRIRCVSFPSLFPLLLSLDYRGRRATHCMEGAVIITLYQRKGVLYYSVLSECMTMSILFNWSTVRKEAVPRDPEITRFLPRVSSLGLPPDDR